MLVYEKENFHGYVVFYNELLSGFYHWCSYLGKRKIINKSQIRSELPKKPFEVLGITEKQFGYNKIFSQSLDKSIQLCRWLKRNDYLKTFSTFKGAL